MLKAFYDSAKQRETPWFDLYKHTVAKHLITQFIAG